MFDVQQTSSQLGFQLFPPCSVLAIISFCMFNLPNMIYSFYFKITLENSIEILHHHQLQENTNIRNIMWDSVPSNWLVTLTFVILTKKLTRRVTDNWIVILTVNWDWLSSSEFKRSRFHLSSPRQFIPCNSACAFSSAYTNKYFDSKLTGITTGCI